MSSRQELRRLSMQKAAESLAQPASNPALFLGPRNPETGNSSVTTPDGSVFPATNLFSASHPPGYPVAGDRPSPNMPIPIEAPSAKPQQPAPSRSRQNLIDVFVKFEAGGTLQGFNATPILGSESLPINEEVTLSLPESSLANLSFQTSNLIVNNVPAAVSSGALTLFIYPQFFFSINQPCRISGRYSLNADLHPAYHDAYLSYIQGEATVIYGSNYGSFNANPAVDFDFTFPEVGGIRLANGNGIGLIVDDPPGSGIPIPGLYVRFTNIILDFSVTLL